MDNFFQAATATAAVTTTVAGGAETGADSADADYVTCVSEGAAAAVGAVTPASWTLACSPRRSWAALLATGRSLGRHVSGSMLFLWVFLADVAADAGFYGTRCCQTWKNWCKSLADVVISSSKLK